MRKFLSSFAAAALLLTWSEPASAHRLKHPSGGGPCVADGSTCLVYCNDGTLAGSMNWNGSVWTDGAKWDKDMNAEADKICAANGRSCI